MFTRYNVELIKLPYHSSVHRLLSEETRRVRTLALQYCEVDHFTIVVDSSILSFVIHHYFVTSFRKLVSKQVWNIV